MRKVLTILIFLALCLIFSSCATTRDLPPDMVITPSEKVVNPSNENNQPKAGYREIVRADTISSAGAGVVWNNLVFTSSRIINLETGEAISVCSDPLCDHHTDGCAKKVLMGASDILLATASPQDDLVLYIFNDEINVFSDKTLTQNYQVLRYHFQTGDVTVLAENLPGDTFFLGIDPLTDIMFFEQRLVNDAGKTEYFLYILNGKTGVLDILPTPNMLLLAKYVVDDTVYCLDSISGEYYCINLSNDELVIQKADTVKEYGDYRYYRENIVEEKIFIPDELLPLCEKYGVEPYRVFTKFDMYRVKIGEENAEPELVAQNILDGGRVGDYFYYYEFAPQHVISYFIDYYADEKGARHFLKYSLDDPDVPQSAHLVNEFNEYYVPIHILDIATLQEVTVIESEQYWVDPMYDLRLVGDGVLVTWQERDPLTYLNKMTNGYTPKRIFGYLYFNKPYLTFEDTVEFDLSESGF